jgi:DUF4097 and DUF4098 domain-containing protein YvlB
MVSALALMLGSSGVPFSLAQDAMQEGSGPTNALQHVEKEFNIPAGKRLDLQLQTGGSINITGWDKDMVSIKLTIGGRDWQDCRFEANETASTLHVVSRYQGKRNSYSTSLHFEIKVPKSFDVEIESAGGDIRISNVSGDLRGKTMGGLLDLRNVGGELNLTTMGGNVILASSEINGKVKTMGGQVLIQDVTGDIQGSSMGGEVKYINVINRDGKAIH